MNAPRTRPTLATLIIGLGLLPGCTTVLLWEGDPDDGLHDSIDGGIGFRLGEAGMKAGGWKLLYKIPLTPVTVAFDMLTAPIQEQFLPDEEPYEPHVPPGC